MRRVRFIDPGGMTRTGEWTADGIVSDAVYDHDAVNVLPPTEPSKIVGVSSNVEALIAEYDALEELPDRPKLFVKTPNTVSGHRSTVRLPEDETITYEAELAAVIGEQCRHVSPEDAVGVLEGFTCANDLTNVSEKDTYGVRFKSFDYSGVVGPVVVPPELVPDGATIECRVNGEVRQHFSRADLHFSVADAVAEITSFMTLEAGDVVMMGTAPYIGQLHDGDVVEVEIEGIGTLEHGVRTV